jgi:Ras-related GTP-binding protein A/B
MQVFVYTFLISYIANVLLSLSMTCLRSYQQRFGSTEDSRYDRHRFERISNIVKQFKLSCTKTQSQFQGMEVRNSNFTALIDLFTGNTYIMVIMTGESSKIPTTLTQLNISAARPHFDKFFAESA